MLGKFITVEGCDGLGKSTQVRLLKERFLSEGVDAFFTREPGGTPIAEKIREIILDSKNNEMDSVTELMLYEASRRQHTQELILKELQKGRLVICDRYIDSTAAYQGFGRGLDLDMINRLNAWAMGDVAIEKTLFLDVSHSEGFLRKGGADKRDRMESMEDNFFKRVYEGFKEIGAKEKSRFVMIDASGSKMETHEKIYAFFKENRYFDR